jgi:GWxTD domain-containing protein
MEAKTFKRLGGFIGAAAVLTLAACTLGPGLRLDPESKAFYETSSLVMTDAERDIFVHLPDLEARREFIKDFWDKRDPNPETPENEFRREFENRIDYVNKRFNEGQRGYNTDRGRIYLYLGPPDRFEEYQDSPLNNQFETVLIWYYYRYDLGVIFRKPIGQNAFRLAVDDIYGDLLNAIEMAKLGETFLSAARSAGFINFGLNYDPGKKAFDISIPVKRVNFRDIEGKLVAAFDFEFTIYKIGVAGREKFSETRDYAEMRDTAQASRNIMFSIPRELAPGKYYVDVVLNGKEGAGNGRKIIAVKR